MRALFFASKAKVAEPAKPVRVCETWAGPFRIFLFGALVLFFSLAFAPGEAQAHGAHAAVGASELATSGERINGMAAEVGSELQALDCTTCCASAGCLAVVVGLNPALPDYDVPRGTYMISSPVPAYQAARQGLRRPPKLNI